MGFKDFKAFKQNLLCHVNITVSTNFALRLRNSSTSHLATLWIVSLFYLSLRSKFSFDAKGLFTQFIHHTLSFRAKNRCRTSESKIESWGADTNF